MKKLSCLLLCAALALCCLSGCSSEQQAPAKNSIPVFDVEPDITTALQAGYINVKDHGAVGDDKADDAPALTAAVAAIEQAGGAGTLWFPSGVYRLASNWTLPLGIECVFEKGASLNVASSTATVTFNGTVTAGFQTVFSGEDFKGQLDNEQVFPQWFGAVGDGKTEDTMAFVKALGHTRDLALPNTAGGYLLGRVTVPYMTRVHGYNGKAATIYGTKDTNCIFEFVDGSNQSVAYDLIFRMADCATGACFFFNSATVQRLTHVELYNIWTEGAYNVVKDAHIKGAILSDIVVRDLLALNSRGIAFDTDNFWGFCFLRDSVFDQSGVNAAYGDKAGNCPVIQIGDNAGFIIQNNVVIGSGNKSNSKEVGFDYLNNVATWMDNCEVRSTGSHAFRISGGSHLYFSNVRAKDMFGDGFFIAGALQTQAMNLQVMGRAKQNDCPDVQHGIRITNSIDSQFDNLSVADISGNGMLLTGTGNALTRIDIQNSTRVGLISSGEQTVISGITVAGSPKANIQIFSEKAMLTNAVIGGKKYDCIKDVGNY